MIAAIGLALRFLSYVAPRSAAKIATYLWFTPFPLGKARTPRIPEGARPITFPEGSSVVHGYELGAGPRTALLVHGWGGSSEQYRRIATRLADAGYKSVVIDLPGHGREAGNSTSGFDLANAIEQTVRALGKVDLVVAHSIGAIATGIAMGRSLEAERLVLLAPGVSLHHALKTFAVNLRFRPKTLAAVEDAMTKRFGTDVWDGVQNDMVNIRTPGFIVHDIEDDMIPISHGEFLAEASGLHLMKTRGHGHNGLFRATEVIDAIATLAGESRESIRP